MLILWRALEKDNSTIVQQLSPLLCFVSVIVQEQQLWLHRKFLYTWNELEIVPL